MLKGTRVFHLKFKRYGVVEKAERNMFVVCWDNNEVAGYRYDNRNVVEANDQLEMEF